MSPRLRRVLVRLAIAVAALWTFVITSPQAHRTATSALAAVLVAASLVVTVGWLRTVTFFQPAALGVAAWTTAQLASGGQAMLLTLVGAVGAGVAVSMAALVLAGTRPRGLLPGTSLVVAALAALVVLPRALTHSFPRPVLLGVDLAGERSLYLAATVVVVLAMAVLSTLRRSDLGRRLAALGAGERFASSNGIDVRGAWSEGVALAGGLAGLAGWLLALQARGLPDAGAYSLTAAVLVLAYPLAGGSSSLLGAGLIAVLLTVAPALLSSSLLDQGVLAGALLTLAVVLRPDGLAGIAAVARRDLRRALRAARWETPRWRVSR